MTCISLLHLEGYVTDGLRRALEWHSRGQRFDPAYLHQRPGIKRFQAFFFGFVRFGLENTSLQNWIYENAAHSFTCESGNKNRHPHLGACLLLYYQIQGYISGRCFSICQPEDFPVLFRSPLSALPSLRSML